MKLAGYEPIHLPRLKYLGGQTLTTNGASSAATLPSDATIILISAEDQDCHYHFNAAHADANSPGYISAGRFQWLGPLARGIPHAAINSLHVYSAAACIVHIQYWMEV